LEDLKEILQGQELTNENIQTLVIELIDKSKNKRWYQKITAEGIAEHSIVSAVTLLVESLMHSS
jgi:hypothetical protein